MGHDVRPRSADEPLQERVDQCAAADGDDDEDRELMLALEPQIAAGGE